jgi:hypothetical protein
MRSNIPTVDLIIVRSNTAVVDPYRHCVCPLISSSPDQLEKRKESRNLERLKHINAHRLKKSEKASEIQFIWYASQKLWIDWRGFIYKYSYHFHIQTCELQNGIYYFMAQTQLSWYKFKLILVGLTCSTFHPRANILYYIVNQSQKFLPLYCMHLFYICWDAFVLRHARLPQMANYLMRIWSVLSYHWAFVSTFALGFG